MRYRHSKLNSKEIKLEKLELTRFYLVDIRFAKEKYQIRREIVKLKRKLGGK